MQVVKLPVEVAEALEQIAAKFGRDPQDMALEALLRHLEDMEDLLAAREALAEGGKGVPLGTVMAKHAATPQEVAEAEAYLCQLEADGSLYR
jgi:predicted DNA-binding protein